MIPISLLELGRVRQGSDRRTALNEAREAARAAERLGYTRVWVAEHHNMEGVTTAATSLVIAHIAEGTEEIRVGAGGIMLPNHAPYVIAEQFGTLATLYPGRIDLGLGRAPGTDQETLRALRRTPAASENFPADILELQSYLAPIAPGQKIEAVPGSGTEVPLWILGSSLYGAQLAAHLGFPYGFASHFAPQALDAALRLYRENFRPSSGHARPYALVGVNIIAAETDAEARFLASTLQMAFTNLIRGHRTSLLPPIEEIDTYWNPYEKAHVEQMLACTLIGGPERIREGLITLLERTEADELMIVCDPFEFSKRVRSLEIIAQVAESLS